MTQLLLFGLVHHIMDTIIAGLIAIIIVICVVIMARHKGSRQILLYIMAGVIIIGGIYSGASLIKDINSKSYINGQLLINKTIYFDTFNYTTNTVELYQNGSNYVYSVDLEKTEFDGVKNKYQLYINNYVLRSTINAGSVAGELIIDFYDLENKLIVEADLKINVKFLNNKTQLNLLSDNYTEAQYLMQYITDNGLNIKITKGE